MRREQRVSRLSQSPAPTDGTLRDRKVGQRWKTARYYSNSGLMNTVAGKSALPSRHTTRDCFHWTEKPFHPNVQLRQRDQDEYQFSSKITDSSVAYDPIFHTAKRVEQKPTTRLRLKGFGDRLDRIHLTPATTEYRDVLSSNPTAFHKREGEFTRFSCRSPFA